MLVIVVVNLYLDGLGQADPDGEAIFTVRIHRRTTRCRVRGVPKFPPRRTAPDGLGVPVVLGSWDRVRRVGRGP